MALNRLRCRECEFRHCHWCGVITYVYDGTRGRAHSATREHVLPRSLGGGEGHNVVLGCFTCNTRRGSSLNWDPFHAWVPHGLPRLRRQWRIVEWMRGRTRYLTLNPDGVLAIRDPSPFEAARRRHLPSR